MKNLLRLAIQTNAILCCLHVARSFSISRHPVIASTRTSWRPTTREITASVLTDLKMSQFSTSKILVRLAAQEDKTEELEEAKRDGFDAKGFAGYLVPYALAIFIAIGGTAAFVKFVLLDY